MDTQSAWEIFCSGKTNAPKKPTYSIGSAPTPSQLYISTKTNIAFLNERIDLSSVFWNIPITPHHCQEEGIIKKQMKINSNSEASLAATVARLPEEGYVSQHVIEHVKAVEGRIEFKDVRKISIGLCNKDVSSYRCKKRGAFYNCFSVIIRTRRRDRFCEMHVKVFNTGKLEVPGVQDDEVFTNTMELLCKVLRSHSKHNRVTWDRERTETVLINSNFSTGFLIDRGTLYDILRRKYGIQGRYDPCSYPGIQCDYYFNPDDYAHDGSPPAKGLSDAKKEGYRRMSFMVFRTGSVLIVGKCCEQTLREIYAYLCQILADEYTNISTGIVRPRATPVPKSQRLKTTIITC